MLSRGSIIEKLKEIMLAADPHCAQALPGAREESRLAEDFGMDSIGMLYIVISVEETFGIRFGDVSPADFITLGDVVNYIQEHTA